MQPVLLPGDRLLVDPRAYRDRLPQVGDIVVLVDPEEATRWLIKRVAAVDGPAGRIEVVGDAAGLSRDSRQFGPVPLGSVVGRAYACYYPVDRRRPL
jgi:nickel-type superoxide dismutase maturation protease